MSVSALPTRVFPSNHPLAGCEEKLWRAEEHFHLLDEEIGRFLSGETPPITVSPNYGPDSPRLFRWVVDGINEPPPRLATIVGDCVHNLRSALDHLAFELSFLDIGGKVPPRTIAFPCARTRADWNGRSVQRSKLVGISKRHRKMVVTLSTLATWVRDLVGWFAPEFETARARRLWDQPRGGWLDKPLRLRTSVYPIPAGSRERPKPSS